MLLLFILPAVAGLTGAYHHTQLVLVEIGCHELCTLDGLELLSFQVLPPEKQDYKHESLAPSLFFCFVVFCFCRPYTYQASILPLKYTLWTKYSYLLTYLFL
jgi:hypothetical protein